MVAGSSTRFVRQESSSFDDRGPAGRDPSDRRVQRTQAALIGAFNRLFLERGYAAITPAMIAEAAGVGRSTFYEHYAGKEALLRQSVTIVLRPLADAGAGRPVPSLCQIVQHFWDNRRLARRLFEGRPGNIVRDRLAELIVEAAREKRISGTAPLPMTARSIAAAQLELINVWISGRYPCRAEVLAGELIKCSRGHFDDVDR